MRIGLIFLFLLSACKTASLTPDIAAREQLSCLPLSNSEMLWSDEAKRIFIFGELHGTEQAPKAFAELVCDAARLGPVIVGFEKPESYQAAIDAFIYSDGSDEAVTTLIDDVFVGPGPAFGLTSQAIFDMFLRMRDLRAQGADIQVHAFVRRVPYDRTKGQTPSEIAYAESLSETLEQSESARMLVLVGNVHAMKAEKSFNADTPPLKPMAMHLPADKTMSFNLAHTGGEAWICLTRDCGIHEVPAISVDGAKERIEFSNEDERFDGVWAVGAITASPPVAAPGAE